MNAERFSSELSLDDVFDVLANRYRRRLLFALIDHNAQDDSTRVSADVTIEDENANHLKIQMVHTHLPKLDERGLIEWNRDSNQVEKGARFEDIRPLLELIRDHDD
ncbi:hypothetical protein BG842_09920 [Haladaptatus sp. W1]|uniref:DUF7344 domain-containing protein n=1 Tax=Haladaptatus sp. W1 TaxID=1897478 RepID=UPI00084976E3|nr:hypothetical protein [Haladaptatus sp. W1]ODR83267.1 hypothetical protein BG842_09920 [Haladaptatus sp. W1]